MMLVEKIRRTLPPRCDPGRMVGCGDSPNPNQALGQILNASWFAFPPVSCRLRHDGYRNPDRACAGGVAAARSSAGERF